MRNSVRMLGIVTLAVALICASWVGQASATLNLFYSAQDAALSIDGACAGGCNTAQNALQSNVPNGATVVNAFLYVADIIASPNATPVGSVTLAGNALNLNTFTKLGPDSNAANTYRLDVTSIMKPIIEGTGGLQTHTYTEVGTDMDGAVLVVAYRNAATVGGTAIILDGELAQGGDITTLGFASAYAGGPVIMSLASSFSFQASGQGTNVDVTTSSNAARRLSSCAGGQDDGGAFNGGLITVGGIGDSTANPDPACSTFDAASPRQDDELYDLGQGNSADADPFLAVGDTSITFRTSNPSFDDNVFALFFTSSIRVTDVDDIPTDDTPSDDTPSDDGPPSVPAPATLLLLGIGLLGAGIARRR